MANPYSELTGDVWKYNPDYHRVADFLGVDPYDRLDFNTAKRIDFIVDHVSKKSGKLSDTIDALYKLKKEMGTQTQGQSLITEMFQVARLKQDTNRVKVERQRITEEKKVEKVKAQEQEYINDLQKQIEEEKKLAIEFEQKIKEAQPQEVAQEVNNYVSTS